METLNLQYRNKKTGKLYTMLLYNIMNATNSCDGQIYVVYRSEETQKIYVREQSEFFEKFEELK